MYECSRCNSPTRMHVLVGVSAPAELSHQFSKTNLRSKEVWLTHVNWKTADYICTKTECGHVSNGYGNYVTRLEATIAELRERNSDLEQECINAKNYMVELSKSLTDTGTELRAENARLEAENAKLKEALHRIASEDYRGPRPWAVQVAYEALRGE